MAAGDPTASDGRSRELGFRGSDDWPLYAHVVGDGPLLILLHGGGPDHHSMRPLAERLADSYTVAMPDIRGYGRSVCADPLRHTWSRYVDDVICLIDALGAGSAGLIGTGLGGTITLRACLEHPHRIQSAVVASVEDIEDDDAKAAETELMDQFADRARADGIAAAWELFLPDLQPLIAELVRDAIPRSDAASVAAAAAIGRDRAFNSPTDLAAITTPTLIIPGADTRHPAALAHHVSDLMPAARLATVSMSTDLRTAEDMGRAFAPAIRRFLEDVSPPG